MLMVTRCLHYVGTLPFGTGLFQLHPTCKFPLKFKNVFLQEVKYKAIMSLFSTARATEQCGISAYLPPSVGKAVVHAYG
jgi:hypothetical protein